MTKLTITIDEVEFEALQRIAVQEMRPTKDQVRYLLRRALLGESPPTDAQQIKNQQRQSLPANAAGVTVNP